MPRFGGKSTGHNEWSDIETIWIARVGNAANRWACPSGPDTVDSNDPGAASAPSVHVPGVLAFVARTCAQNRLRAHLETHISDTYGPEQLLSVRLVPHAKEER